MSTSVTASPPAPSSPPAAPAALQPGDGSAAAGEERDPNVVVLSFSRADMYRTCPLKYRFAYVDKLPTQPSPALSWGSAIHAALEAWWDQKLPEAPPVDVLLQGLYDGWDDSGFEGIQRDEKLRWYRHAQDVLRQHHARHAPSYRPAVACEEWFEIDLGDDVVVVGSIDHVAKTERDGIGIVDWKTNRKAKPRRYVEDSLQLAVYALAAKHLWGVDPEWVALDFVVPGVRVTVERERIDTDAALQTLRETAERLREGAFAPTPNRLCDWCDFRAVCPAFEGEGPDVAGSAVVELARLRRRVERDRVRIGELEAVVARFSDGG